MGTPSMESYLTGRDPSATPPTKSSGNGGRGKFPDAFKTTLLVILSVAVAYTIADTYQFRQKNQAELALLSNHIQQLENEATARTAQIAALTGDLSQTQRAVGSTKEELKRTAHEIQSEGQRTKEELHQALSTKADTAQVRAVQHETEAKLGQVSTEIGGVKTEVGEVKTDLTTAKRDLEGTQRQLLDVRETLTAAVAKNSTELSVLRRMGERDYFEFEIAKKNLMTKVEDIRVILTKTDTKKGKYNLTIVVDDNKLEKKDRTINEPVQFLVGRNRLRYEIVVNWVQKDKVGGYLSIPKDRTLSAEHIATMKKD